MERFFLNPWALAYGALAGGIVLLYILRLRRSKVRVSSTLLWERAIHDSRANAPWQKLRHNLLMYLQILALLLLALALARPFIFGSALAGARTVLVVDSSASMLASDGDPDRLGTALSEAQRIVGDLRERDEAMVVAAGPTPRVLTGFTSSKNTLSDALRQVRSDAGGQADLNAALKLVSSVVSGSPARIVIFSDGAVPDLDPFTTAELTINFFPIGNTSDNLGIVAAGARRNPFDDTYELFVAVRNYYPELKTVDLVFEAGGEAMDVRTLTVEPGQREEVAIAGLPYSPEPIRVALDLKDPLDADNEAFVIMPRLVRYKVALSTGGESLLLRRALESLSDVDLFNYDGKELAGAAELPDSRVDVWVVQGDAPAPVDPAVGYLFIDSTSHALLPVEAGTVAELDFGADPPVIPAVVGSQRGHPLLRYVNLADLKLRSMRRTQLKPWARTVVDATEGALIIEGQQQGQRTVYMAFDVYSSDMPLRAAFPMFLSNAVNFLGESSLGAVGRSVQAGARVSLVAPVTAERVLITASDGGASTQQLGTRDFTLSSTTTVGVYALAYQDGEGQEVGSAQVPVSLVSDSESNIAPATTLGIAGIEESLASATGQAEAERIVGSREVRINREFYTWLILLALLIMAGEWYQFHTRAL